MVVPAVAALTGSPTEFRTRTDEIDGESASSRELPRAGRKGGGRKCRHEGTWVEKFAYDPDFSGPSSPQRYSQPTIICSQAGQAASMGYQNHTFEYPGFSTRCAGNCGFRKGCVSDVVLAHVAPT